MTDNIIWLDFNDAPDQRDLEVSDTEALRAGLLGRIEVVVQYLFPHGRVTGSKFTIGDVEGNPGKSLVVELEGERRGLWKDFATDEGGDIFDLWARAHGVSARYDFPRVTDEIRQWLGSTPAAATPLPKPRSAPPEPLGPVSARWDYRSADGEERGWRTICRRWGVTVPRRGGAGRRRWRRSWNA
jgi:putative DNA primase/helicase